MKCDHDLATKETAAADGMCALCLAHEVEVLKGKLRDKYKELAEARKDAYELCVRAELAEDELQLLKDVG